MRKRALTRSASVPRPSQDQPQGSDKVLRDLRLDINIESSAGLS